MSKQSLLDFLLCKTDEYENSDSIGLTRGGGDFQALYSPVCERPMWHTGYDVFGVHWTQANPATHYTPGQEPIVHDIENWEKEVRFPNPDKFDWNYVSKQAESIDRNSKVVVTTLSLGPFERTTTLMAFEEALVSSASDPESYTDLISAIVDYKIKIVDKLAQYGHPDVINLHDDWGTATSTFFSPNTWRKIIRPHTQRLYDAIRDRGIIVGQHSCGKVESLVGDMIEMGASIWEGNGYCNDIQAVEDLYGNKIRVFAPPLKAEDNVTDAERIFPAIESVGLCYRPYDSVPEFLYA